MLTVVARICHLISLILGAVRATTSAAWQRQVARWREWWVFHELAAAFWWEATTEWWATRPRGYTAAAVRRQCDEIDAGARRLIQDSPLSGRTLAATKAATAQAAFLAAGAQPGSSGRCPH